MKPVYQTLFVKDHGVGNCMNACVASILEIDITEASDILPNTKADWNIEWKKWFLERGMILDIASKTKPPEGYSIASCYTDRYFSEDHPNSGERISHACVALNGKIIFDPYPNASDIYEINYYFTILPYNFENDDDD